MRTRAWPAIVAASVACILQPRVLAQGTPAPRTVAQRADSAADAYCRFVSGAAASQAHALAWPRLRASFGTYRGFTDVAADGGNVAETTGRFMAGLEYDVFDTYRGVTLNDRAAAECRRYRAAATLQAFLSEEAGLESAAALRAQLAVLDAALPEAEAMRQAVAAEVAGGTATLEELAAIEERVHALRLARIQVNLAAREAAQTERKVAELAPALRAHQQSEDEVERYDARLRELSAFRLGLQGGYDYVLDADNEVPLYGMVTFSYAFGGLFQPAADARAREGRRAFAREQLDGLQYRAEQVLERARALRDAQRERLALHEPLIAELERRMTELTGVPGERASGYARHVWFDLVRAQAERAYLVEHIQTLTALLRGGTDAAD